MFGVLRKPQMTREKIGGGPGGGGRFVSRVTAFAILPDGNRDGDFVYAAREDLAWNPDTYTNYGSQAYVERPPRVYFELDPENPRKAIRVRFPKVIEQ